MIKYLNQLYSNENSFLISKETQLWNLNWQVFLQKEMNEMHILDYYLLYYYTALQPVD